MTAAQVFQSPPGPGLTALPGLPDAPGLPGLPGFSGVPGLPDPAGSRRAVLADRLASVRSRIDAAATAAGRLPQEITLVVVTKTWPASDARLLAGLGVRDMGENQDQQAAAKAAECADLPGLRWHFVGRLQSNKAASVARYAGLVHSVDRPSLVNALDRGAERAGRRLPCLVQVSLDGAPGRGGIPLDRAAELADAVAAAPALELGGVMAVAPLGTPADEAFARLAEVSAVIREAHPHARVVSAGMSGDLEAAVAAGATHLRVGSAILGRRDPHGTAAPHPDPTRNP